MSNSWSGYHDSHLKVEQSQGDVLDQFLRNILWVEFGSELELEGRLFLHILEYRNINTCLYTQDWDCVQTITWLNTFLFNLSQV